MTKLIPRSKLQLKINRFKEGGSIPKYLNSGILKSLYYWRSPDYSRTKDGKKLSFTDAYTLAKSNNDEDFWWTDNNGNRNVYDTNYNLLRYNYLKALENPNDVGYIPTIRIWTTPNQKGFDSNLIGIGLDTKTNNFVRRYLEKTKRTKEPWLTLREMEQLLNQSLAYFESVFDKNTRGVKISDIKRAIAIGLLYHGHGPNIWNHLTPKTKKVYNALIYGSDLDLIDAVSDFYKGNSRSLRHDEFWK